jgi:hypothetical protein
VDIASSEELDFTVCIASSDELDCTECVLRQVTKWIVQSGYRAK